MNQDDIYSTLFKLAESVELVARAKIATGIFKRNRPVAFGFNTMKSHPFQKKFAKVEKCIYLHSEIDALKNALREIQVEDLKKCDVYICRVKKDKRFGKNVPGLAKPCSGCQRALRTFGVKNVYYSRDNISGFSCL